MLIRTFEPEDYDAVYTLWRNTAGMGLNDIDDSREGIEKFLKRNPRTCFVAETEAEDGARGDIVGVIIAGNDGRRGYIYHTSVLQSIRQGGIGRRLVTAALDALLAEGISKVAVVVFDRNEIGNAFWEKIGFSKRTDLVYRNKALVEIERIDT